jgi:DeoR/GlpR family transcriptional regulator of sugar metabolism
MIAAERQQRISERLRTERVVSIADLGTWLGVSDMTVRRDLIRLEELGLCRRTHGGAVSVHAPLVQDTPYTERELQHVAEKIAIGRAAAALVEEGDTIAIDSGSTTMQFAAALRGKKNVTVVTNSIRVLNQLYDAAGIIVISTGGTISTTLNPGFRHDDPFLVGPLAEATMRRFRPNKAFMGTVGLTIADGLSNGMLEQAELKRIMMEVSAEVTLLTDHSKFGHVSFAVAGPVTMLQRVITDTGITPSMRRALEELGIEVVAVEPATDVSVTASMHAPAA